MTMKKYVIVFGVEQRKDCLWAIGTMNATPCTLLQAQNKRVIGTDEKKEYSGEISKTVTSDRTILPERFV